MVFVILGKDSVMRLLLLYSCLLLVSCSHFKKEYQPPIVSSEEQLSDFPEQTTLISFKDEIQPILVSRCMPCHFTGGKMYERLPFDTAATVYHLGDKLFSRITDEHEKQLIKDFVAQEVQD